MRCQRALEYACTECASFLFKENNTKIRKDVRRCVNRKILVNPPLKMLRMIRRFRYRAEHSSPQSWLNTIAFRYLYTKHCLQSLLYNHHLNQSYVSDVCLEPIIWFVDNYTHVLGPIFVIAVFILTTTFVFICWYVGYPWWTERCPSVTPFLVVFGNWLLLNVTFHYFAAAFTKPGYPPEELISNAVSICKKCIAPKPPRKLPL